MPRSVRASTIVAALFGLVFLLGAIWLPERDFWKLIISSFIMFLVALVIMAVNSPERNK